MSKFNIGDDVRIPRTNESGVITDRMFSEAKEQFLYSIKPHDGGRTFIRKEDDLEPFNTPAEYKIDVEIEDNVVIVVAYEIRSGIKTEVFRGHGHIMHDGAIGIAQALSYAAKRGLASIDNGIYFKQNRRDF